MSCNKKLSLQNARWVSPFGGVKLDLLLLFWSNHYCFTQWLYNNCYKSWAVCIPRKNISNRSAICEKKSEPATPAKAELNVKVISISRAPRLRCDEAWEKQANCNSAQIKWWNRLGRDPSREHFPYCVTIPLDVVHVLFMIDPKPLHPARQCCFFVAASRRCHWPELRRAEVFVFVVGWRNMSSFLQKKPSHGFMQMFSFGFHISRLLFSSLKFNSLLLFSLSGRFESEHSSAERPSRKFPRLKLFPLGRSCEVVLLRNEQAATGACALNFNGTRVKFYTIERSLMPRTLSRAISHKKTNKKFVIRRSCESQSWRMMIDGSCRCLCSSLGFAFLFLHSQLFFFGGSGIVRVFDFRFRFGEHSIEWGPRQRDSFPEDCLIAV